jgi:thiamine biosynthesis lipoprotein
MMGTYVELTIFGEDREACAAAADATLERMAALERSLSRHSPDSELSALVRDGRLSEASDGLLDVLRLARRVSDWGHGAFDITVQPVLDLYAQGKLPSADAIEQALTRVDYRAVQVDGATVTLARPDMRITLDGIGKGYIVDQGVATLRARGFANVFLDAGGDLVAGGEKTTGRPWRIGIRHPRDAALQARFDARDRAVATSGDYMQPYSTDYAAHHIVDPRTGRSAPELASSTVLAPSAALADALATLTMALGPAEGRNLLEALPDCEGYFVSKELAVTRTSGFAAV